MGIYQTRRDGFAAKFNDFGGCSRKRTHSFIRADIQNFITHNRQSLCNRITGINGDDIAVKQGGICHFSGCQCRDGWGFNLWDSRGSDLYQFFPFPTCQSCLP